MDFSSLIGNAESLAFLYAWTFLAAGVFALIEKFVAARKAQSQSN